MTLLQPLFAFLFLLAGFAVLYWVFAADEDQDMPENDPRFDYFYDEHR